MDDILVNIVCRLPGHEDKKFDVSTSDRNTVAGLIRKACKENNIPMRSSYMLLDRREKALQWSQSLTHCGVKHGDTLYLTCEEDEVHMSNGCSWNSWWFVAAISLLIGGVGITAITILFTKNGETDYQYGVVLDAGSSHTNLYVYKWDGKKLHNTALARQSSHVCTVKDNGLTSYKDAPSNLSAPLSVCLDEAKQHIQVDKRKSTPIFLGATAGMRMLNETDPDISFRILSEVRETIQKYPFMFPSAETQARIITGQEEGTFGWVTANYVSGKLGVLPTLSDVSSEDDTRVHSAVDTIGALDMGGASTQITFYTPTHGTVPPGYKEDLVLYGSNFSVYTHSYLCYGINEAIRRYTAILVYDQGYNETTIDNPCGPAGNITTWTYTDIFEAPCATKYAGHFLYLQPTQSVNKNTTYTLNGTGNDAVCQATVARLFNFTATCAVPPCSFNGTYQPPVHGQFYAFSSFFYEMDFLNLTRKEATLSQFTKDLTKLCVTPWDTVKTMKAGDGGKMLGWYCFEGHYIHTLLTQGYRFDNTTWSNIQFIQKINHTDIGWTLGYMINSSSVIPPVSNITFISTGAFSALTVLFVLFLLVSIGFACHARRHQKTNSGLYESVPSYGAV